MFQQKVQTTIRLVLLRQGKVFAQKIPHRAAHKPLAMKPEFRSRIDQAKTHERLEHAEPTSPLAARPQARRPKPVQVKNAPQVHRQPAGPPLPGTPQLNLVQPHTNGLASQRRQFLAILGKQRQLPRARPRPLQRLNRMHPSRALRVIEFAQVQHLTLCHAPVAQTTILHHAPVAMRFSVLGACLRPKKHRTHFRELETICKGGRSALQAVLRMPALETKNLRADTPRKKTILRSNCEGWATSARHTIGRPRKRGLPKAECPTSGPTPPVSCSRRR